MSYRWSPDTVFQELTLQVDERLCSHCGHALNTTALDQLTSADRFFV